MEKNYKEMVETIREALKDVQSGKLTEGSLFFLIGMIVNPTVITQKDIDWARTELDKMYRSNLESGIII